MDGRVGSGRGVIMAKAPNRFRYQLQTAIGLYADTHKRQYHDVVKEINDQLGYPEGTAQKWLNNNIIPNAAEVGYLAKKLTSGTKLDHKWIQELYDLAGYEPPQNLVTPKPVPPITAAGESYESNQARILLYKQEMQEYIKSSTQVFLSYARQDQEFVERLYTLLQESGFKPWMDSRDIVGGENWLRAVYRAIEESQIFLAILSANSVSRRGIIQKELKKALDKWEGMLPDDIYIIPLRIDNCPIPELLKDLQVIDWDEGNGADKLLEAIQIGLERRRE
jgi:hypothetical protein